MQSDSQPADIRDRLLAMTAHSTRAWLGPAPDHSEPHAICYDETWRLYVNVTREELQGSAGLGQRKSLRKDS